MDSQHHYPKMCNLKHYVQYQVRNVKFFRPGYAIEYDYFPPTQLNNTLETKLVPGLFLLVKLTAQQDTRKLPLRV